LLTPSVETCKAQLSTSCEAQCHQQFVSGACELKSDGACRFGYNTPQKFADCLAACAGTTQPVPVCKGDNLCSCDYTQCGFCMKPLTVQATVNGVATTSTVNLHQCIDLSTPCVVDPSATFLTAKPATCFVDGAKTATDDSTDKPELEKKVESIDTTKVQEKVIANANTVQEAKDFIIAVKNQLSPVTNADNSVKVSVVVTVSGDRAPTDTEINAICSKVVIDAVQQVLDSTKQITLTLKNCNKIVSDSTKKRGVLQSNSQDVLVEGNAAGSTPSGTGTTNPTGTNPTGSSSAASVFMSLAALLLATVALLL